MKPLPFCLVLLSMSNCAPSESQRTVATPAIDYASLTLEDLLKDTEELKEMFGDTAVSNGYLFSGSVNEIQGDWFQGREPYQVTYRSRALGNPSLYKGVAPERWVSRTGLGIGLSIQDVQELNGKPFYVITRENDSWMMNWEGGALAGTATVVYFETDGELPKVVMSSQEIIDLALIANVEAVSVYAPGKWEGENIEPSQGWPGRWPFVSYRLLTESDAAGKDAETLRLMRNEVFARKGYIFQSGDLQEFFGYEPWYAPVNNDVSAQLSDIEKENIEFLVQAEQRAK